MGDPIRCNPKICMKIYIGINFPDQIYDFVLFSELLMSCQYLKFKVKIRYCNYLKNGNTAVNSQALYECDIRVSNLTL